MFEIIGKKYKRFKRWMNYDPPFSLSSKGWRLFNKEFKEVAPIRYYLNNDFKRNFILPILWKYDAIRDWVLYRTIRRYHKLDTGLKPGYHDIVTKMLHVNFNMLKDFVEVEQAWQAFWWGDEGKLEPRWKKYIPFYYRNFRRPDLGVEHFKWASTLDDPNLPPHERSVQQAKDAREILVLYKWWVEDRPARKEIEHTPYNDQGLGGILGCFDDDFDRDAEDFKAHVSSMEAASRQEEDWNNEDEEMLIRLIKIRKGLWT